jgi:hypothetical protein
MRDIVDSINTNRLSLNLDENASTAERKVDVFSVGVIILAYCRRSSLLYNKKQIKECLTMPCVELEKPVLMCLMSSLPC